MCIETTSHLYRNDFDLSRNDLYRNDLYRNDFESKRPDTMRSRLHEFAEDASSIVVVTHGLAVVALYTISTKKVGDQLPANLQH